MHSHSRLKDLLRGLIPGPLLRARQAWRNRRRERYAGVLAAATGGRVLGGPFAGMQYVTAGAGSALGPKLLGTYESEIHPAVENLIAGPFDVVVNVGAGEGYYAVGLLTRMPAARGWAYEGDPRGQALIRELAALNGEGGRLEVGGFCTPDDLARAVDAARAPAVVIDVEGAEGDLLDPGKCPGLRRAAVLVEVHEYLRPGVTDALLGWYAASHDIRRTPTVAAGGLALPGVPGLTRGQVRLLADEMRPAPMEWFWMTPRH